MNLKTYSVIVIGGGPCGLITAREIAKAGLDVLVLEEHKEIGRPQHCAGLVSLRCLKELRIANLHKIVLNRIKRAKVHFPNGTTWEIRSPRINALVIDRIAFDKELYREALDVGAQVLTSCRALKINVKNDYVKILALYNDNKVTFKSRLLVLSEGLCRRITKSILRVESKPLIGIQEDYGDCSIDFLDEDNVDIYLDKKLSRRFFGWAIPLGNKIVRIGLASDKNIGERFSNFKDIDDVRVKIEGASRIRVMSGLINIDGPLKRFVQKRRVVLVGDAAGQNKLTTGGGLYYGGLGAIMLGEAIIRYFEYKEPLSALYERRWYSIFGREIRIGRVFRNFFDTLSNADLIKIGDECDEIVRELVSSSSFDFHASALTRAGIKLLFKLIKNLDSDIYKGILIRFLLSFIR